MASILGYWDMRGIVEPIRLMLYYTETEFEDKRYQFGPTEARVKEIWHQEKNNHGLDFPNLPYYIDGDIKLTQSLAILRHIARKNGLMPGDSEEERSRADLLEQQSHDLMWNLVSLAYNPNFATAKEIYIKNLGDTLAAFSKLLGTQQWLIGDKLTYVDFHFYEALSMQKLLVPECLKKLTNLEQYLKRFETLPKIEKYMKSGKYKTWPICNPYAKFGGDPPPAP